MKVRSLQFAWLCVGTLAAGVVFLWWWTGNNRAACHMNVRNVQQAMRSYQGMNNLAQGTPLDRSALTGPGKMLEKEPVCPTCGPYRWSPVVPGIGTLMIECEHTSHSLPPAQTYDW